MTKSRFKNTQKKQFCNPLRNYTGQNAETPPNPPVRKSTPKRTASAVSSESAENLRQTKIALPRNLTKPPHLTPHTS